MGTEVLRPQDVFYDRFRLSSPAFHRRKTYSNYGNGFGNPRPNNTNTNNHHNSGYKKPAPRPERQVLHRKRRSSSAPPPPPPPHQPQEPEFQLLPRRSSSAAELQNNPARVTILRRGQSLDTIDATRMKRDLNSEAIGGLMRKKFMDEDDVYAGSAFFASPSPSSLPLPSFFNNNNNHISINKDEFHHSATRDLRRLLGLE